MKRIVLLAMSIILCSQSIYPQSYVTKNKSKKGTSVVPKSFLEQITADELSASLHYFASDFFAGRRVGTKNELAAAYYLASQ